jgi:hypothetical protein
MHVSEPIWKSNLIIYLPFISKVDGPKSMVRNKSTNPKGSKISMRYKKRAMSSIKNMQ